MAMILGATAAAVLVAMATGVIALPDAQDTGQSAQTVAQASLAAAQTAADQQWAAATCTTILTWKNEVRHDVTSLDLSFGALSRIQDAIASTTRTLNTINRLGLPPAARSAQAQADLDQLRSDIQSHVHTIQDAAGSVLSGHLDAIGTLVDDIENEKLVERRSSTSFATLSPSTSGFRSLRPAPAANSSESPSSGPPRRVVSQPSSAPGGRRWRLRSA